MTTEPETIYEDRRGRMRLKILRKPGKYGLQYSAIIYRPYKKAEDEHAQLASHNSHFDGPFLTEWFDRLGIFLPASYRVFCTLQRAYWLFHEYRQLPPPDDFRLGTLCQYFDVPLSPADAHEAMADARATIAVYRAILQAENDLASIATRSSQASKSVCTQC